MKMNIETAANEAFNQLQDIWKPIAGERLIIPFCTPMIERPDVLVIGQNHASFTGNNADLPFNDPIGLEMSKGVPKVNTYIEHEHTFAHAMNLYASELSTDLRNWVGTNACAIQAESSDFEKNIYSHPSYERTREEASKVLRKLIREHIQPKNIFLMGMESIKIYKSYFLRKEKHIINLDPYKDLHLKDSHNTIRLFALWYPYGQHVNKKDRSSLNLERLKNAGLIVK